MSEYLGDAVLELSANLAPLKAGLAEAERLTLGSTSRMQGSIARGLGGTSAALHNVGRRMTSMVTVPILGIGAASAKMSTDFQAAMEMIHTQAGAPQKEVQALHDKVLALAKVVAQSPTALAEGLFHLESIGLRASKSATDASVRMRAASLQGANAMTALKVAAEGAAIGNANLEQTATALGSAWLVNIKGGGDLQKVMAVLNATVGVGNVRMGQLVEALGTGLLPQAKVAGLALTDAMGALAVFTDEGYKASSASAQLATALHYLFDPTKKATDALASIHIKQAQLAEDMHKPRGLLLALSDLKDHLDKLPGGSKGVKAEQVLGNIFPAGRGRVLLTLMNQLDRYKMKLDAIDKGQAKFSHDFAATQQTAAFKARAAWDGLQAKMIQFGDRVLPTLVNAGQEVIGFADQAFTAFNRLPSGLQHSIITGGLILAGVGPALRVLGAFTGGLSKLASIATVAQRLSRGQSFKQALGRPTGAGPGALAHPASMTVDTMEVGELVARAATGIGSGGLGNVISGVHGTNLPGSPLNPIVVALESGPLTGLGDRAAPLSGAGGGIGGSGAARAESELAGASSEAAAGVGAFGRALNEQLVMFERTDVAGYTGAGEYAIPSVPTVGRNAKGQFTKLPQEQLPLFDAGPAARSRYTSLTNLGPEATATIDAEAMLGPSLLARIRSGAPVAAGMLKSGLSRGMGALGIAGMGLIGSQLAGQFIPGRAGQIAGHVGTYASIGAGLGSLAGPEGTAIGAIGGAIVGGLTELFHSQSFGQRVASSLTPGFGGANRANLQKTVSTALDELKKYTTGSRTITGARGSQIQLPVHLNIDALDPAQREKAMQAAKTAGLAIAKQLEAGWGQYKYQSEPVMFLQLRAEMKKLPPEAQSYAIQSAYQFSTSLEKQGRLAKGSTDQFLAQIMREFPAAVRRMGVFGHDTVDAFAKALDFSHAQDDLKTELRSVENDFSQVQQTVNDTSGTVEDKSGAAIKALLRIAKDGTGPMRRAALADIRALRDTATSDFEAMEQKVSAQMGSLSKNIQGGSSAAASAAESSFGQMARAIAGAVASGTLATNKGAKLIGRALNAELKAFGAKPLPLADLKDATPQSLLSYANWWQNGSAGSTGSGIGHRAATGGLMPIGRPGAGGYDTVPLTVGNRNIVVGEGETVAVFNRHQWPAVNARFADTGGLAGFFAQHRKPNYAPFAAGGIAAGGQLSYAQLEGLWDQGNPGLKSYAPIMAAIAMAESSGRDVVNSIGASGYWQIFGLPFPGNPLDPLTNARMAGAKLRSQGLGAWVTYTTGAYRQFLKGGVPPAAAAAMAAMIATPRVQGGGTMGRLAGGALKLLANAANTYLDRSGGTMGAGAVGPVAGGGGGFSPSQLGSFDGFQVAKWIIPELLWARQHGWSGHVTSGYRPPWEVVHGVFATAPQGQSEHRLDIYPGGAVDVSDYEQFASIIRGYPGAQRLIQLGIDPLHFSGTGHALGGLLSFADGGLFTTHARRAPGSTLPIRHGSGYRKPTHTSSRSSSSSKAKPKQKNVKSAKNKKTTKLPKFKPLPGFDSSLLNQIAAIDGQIQNYSSWQGYLQSLHGVTSTEAIVTLADGSQVVNWNGMVDPATGQWVKGINQRLAEIGDPGPSPDATATRDPNTELGIDELMLDAYGQQQTLAGKAAKRFGPWLRRMIRDLKKRQRQAADLQARIKRTTELKAKLPQERSDRSHAITERFARAIHNIQVGSAGRSFSASALLAAQTAALATEERRAKGAIPTSAPSSWSGSASAWSAQRRGEILDITDEFAQRRVALENAARRSRFQGTVARSNALFGLRMEESAEKQNLTDHFDTLGRRYSDELSGWRARLSQAKKYVSSDQSALNDATGNKTGSLAASQVGSGSFYDTLRGYTQPMGPLAINVDTMRNVNIASLLNEIGQLKGTTVTQTPAAPSNDSSVEATLLAQIAAQAKDAYLVSQAQYAVLANLPPFGGSFLTGGIVPGPIGAARTIIAHGGEEITPVERTGVPHVILTKGPGVEALIDARIEHVNRRTARTVGMNLPSRGGGGLRP